MAKLTAKDRKKLSSVVFGLPKERKYPMPDKSHAANAKARATQMVDKGKLSESQKDKIDAKANKVLGKSEKGAKPKPMKRKKRLVKGMKANTPKGFKQNVKVMEKAGYKPKRAVGAAYGESYLSIDRREKKARQDRKRK